MRTFSTNQVAKKLGIAAKTLSRYIEQKKVPSPQIIEVGGIRLHSWTQSEIEMLRRLLPKIANGRKTRYQKLRDKQKTQARAPVPHKQGPHKKK